MPKKAAKKKKDDAQEWNGERRSAEALELEKSRRQRNRIPKALPTPTDGKTAWSKQQVELKGFHVGLQALALEATSEYSDILLPYLEKVNARRRADAQYSTMELERAEFVQRAAGFVDKKTLVEKLQLMKMAPVREALDFARPRNPEHRAVALRNTPDGIPSEPTFTRHNQSMNEDLRVAYWESLGYALRDRYLSMPGVADELRTINIDGFHIPIPFTSPRYETDDDGVVHIVNAEYVTAPATFPKTATAAETTALR
jgi:hypothetical protein